MPNDQSCDNTVSSMNSQLCLGLWTVHFCTCMSTCLDWLNALMCAGGNSLLVKLCFFICPTFWLFCRVNELQMFIYIWILWILKKTYSLFFLFISFMLQILVSWFLLICWNKSVSYNRSWPRTMDERQKIEPLTKKTSKHDQ